MVNDAYQALRDEMIRLFRLRTEESRHGNGLLLVNGVQEGVIEAIQMRLRALGNDLGPIDGMIGPRTLAALQRYAAGSNLQLADALETLRLSATQVERPAPPVVQASVATPSPATPTPISYAPSGGDFSASADGRYRIVVVPMGRRGNTQTMLAEMRVLDPSGNVVWHSTVASGRASGQRPGPGGGEPLPGLTQYFPGRLITASYPINGYDSRVGDRLFSYANGENGFAFGLENASNMEELGAAGTGPNGRRWSRDYFNIHPTGGGIGTAGCLEILSEDGRLGPASDKKAREFARLYERISPDQRPRALEILNPDMVSSSRTYIASHGLPPGTEGSRAPSPPRQFT